VQLFLIPKIIIRKSLIHARYARDFVHARTGEPLLRENFSRGDHDSLDRVELTPLAENPSSDGRKLPVSGEIVLGRG
jgi:hypothetical protein